MAKRQSQSGSDGAGGAVFGVLLIVGIVIHFFWWFVAAGVAVGLFFVVRATVRHIDEQRAAAAREAEQLAYRADRQNRWARRGDSRGVYGPTGAELMRQISPDPSLAGKTPRAQPIVTVAQTKAELSKLLADKPAGWRWAAFASVLVQRRSAVQSRLLDCELGYATQSGSRARGGDEVARFAAARMEDLNQLVTQVEAFMSAPAFMGVFGDRGDESTADGDGILHVANRLMDYHERFLELAERCRDFGVPTKYTGLLRDCSHLMSIPLDGYETFIDDFVEQVGDIPDLLRYGRGTVEADPVMLHMDVDDQLLKRITKQIKAAAKS